MTPRIGETWRWWHEDEDHPSYSWDDLWLLLANDYPNNEMFLAIDLVTGKLTSVWPMLSPDDWERVL